MTRKTKQSATTDIFPHMTILGGYKVDKQGRIIRTSLASVSAGADTGADPMGDGTFRMYPSGDIVDFAERNRRLAS